VTVLFGPCSLGIGRGGSIPRQGRPGVGAPAAREPSSPPGANSAHTRRTRENSGRGFQVKHFKVFPLRSDAALEGNKEEEVFLFRSEVACEGYEEEEGIPRQGRPGVGAPAARALPWPPPAPPAQGSGFRVQGRTTASFPFTIRALK